MVVTITRTAWTDDDGSGTTGTVINNAAKTSIYDQIDAALAALLPIAGGTLTGDLLFTDATYDIGKSGATRPRDGFFSRNVVIGGTLAVTGVATFSATTMSLRGVTYTLPSADGSSGYALTTNGSAALSWAAVSGSIPNPIAVDLLFTDATYDIGKSGATRPRDGFFSRNFVIGGTLGVTGLTTLAALTTTGNISLSGLAITASNGLFQSTTNVDKDVDIPWRFINTNSDPGYFFLDNSGGDPNSTDNAIRFRGGGSTDRFAVRLNGGIANFSANNVNLSDADVKDIAGDAPPQRALFRKLTLVEARYKDATTPTLDVMCTAQDVERVYPELVTPFADGHIGVREHGLMMRAFKVIQELDADVLQLSARLAALEA